MSPFAAKTQQGSQCHSPPGPQPTALGMGTGLDLSNIPSPRRTASEHTTINRRKAMFFHTDLSEEEVRV